jgi:hypothetical protein
MVTALIPHLVFGVMPGINEPLEVCTLNLQIHPEHNHN